MSADTASAITTLASASGEAAAPSASSPVVSTTTSSASDELKWAQEREAKWNRALARAPAKSSAASSSSLPCPPSELAESMLATLQTAIDKRICEAVENGTQLKFTWPAGDKEKLLAYGVARATLVGRESVLRINEPVNQKKKGVDATGSSAPSSESNGNSTGNPAEDSHAVPKPTTSTSNDFRRHEHTFWAKATLAAYLRKHSAIVTCNNRDSALVYLLNLALVLLYSDSKGTLNTSEQTSAIVAELCALPMTKKSASSGEASGATKHDIGVTKGEATNSDRPVKKNDNKKRKRADMENTIDEESAITTHSSTTLLAPADQVDGDDEDKLNDEPELAEPSSKKIKTKEGTDDKPSDNEPAKTKKSPAKRTAAGTKKAPSAAKKTAGEKVKN